MGTNFPASPNSMDFATFSYTMGNSWGNPSVSHIMKYTIGWESKGKEAPIPWEKYEHKFPRFCYIFSCYGKLMGKPMHFSYDEVYH